MCMLPLERAENSGAIITTFEYEVAEIAHF